MVFDKNTLQTFLSHGEGYLLSTHFLWDKDYTNSVNMTDKMDIWMWLNEDIMFI